MKKIHSLFLFLLACCFAFQSCSDSKTYAEMLEDEKKAIDAFINEKNIKIITAEEFETNNFETNVSENEYVQFSNGVYMQILYKGEESADSIKSRDIVSVRLVEYDIMEKDTTISYNFSVAQYLDSFDYTVYGTTALGELRINQGEYGIFYLYYSTTQVPEGWLVPLRFIRSGARVRLIVPSKVGHSSAMQYVTPFYYDLIRITVW